MTTFGRSLKTFAVAPIGMTTGVGPQSKTMMPPWATAATTAAEVQLAGVPVPTTWSGSEVSARRASTGIGEWPVGFPVAGGGGTIGSRSSARTRNAAICSRVTA